MLSPQRMTTEPPACLAHFPVSTMISLPPTRAVSRTNGIRVLDGSHVAGRGFVAWSLCPTSRRSASMQSEGYSLSSDSTERSNQRDSNVRRRYVASSWFAGRYGTLRTERKGRNPHEFHDTDRRGNPPRRCTGDPPVGPPHHAVGENADTRAPGRTLTRELAVGCCADGRRGPRLPKNHRRLRGRGQGTCGARTRRRGHSRVHDPILLAVAHGELALAPDDRRMRDRPSSAAEYCQRFLRKKVVRGFPRGGAPDSAVSERVTVLPGARVSPFFRAHACHRSHEG